MDKRYQVFISSTFEDLQDERKEIIQALLELNCIPAGMELFPAANEEQFTLIKRVIDDCDYYILVVGGRYGSISPKTGISYTEMEYDYAVSKGKPVLTFVHRDPSSIIAGKTERTDEGKRKLAEFRTNIQASKMCKTWASAGELGGVVSRSLVQQINSAPGVGWVRADSSAIEQLASTEILRLRHRIEELEDEVQKLKTAAPGGTEHLAQGDDPFTMRYLVSLTQQVTPYRS